MLQGKILIAQGGGPTAVINQSLVGAVQEARRLNAEGVYGALHVVSGIVNETMIDLSQESDSNLEQVATTPCSALGSTRDKPDLPYCQEIFKVLSSKNLEARSQGIPMRVIPVSIFTSTLNPEGTGFE